MNESIGDIFKYNIGLLAKMDKAVIYFREQECDKALKLIANSIDEVKLSIELIISNREYFNVVKTESMLEMLTGILEAKRNSDYVLLADLLELQLINFLTGVQELIISKEEIEFNEDNYNNSTKMLMSHSEGFEEMLHEPINTARLLEKGYRVEFTSCGLMTLAAENQGERFYFHTNNKIQTEAFLLARNWYQMERKHYNIYGFGMGYHLRELLAIDPQAEITIYESDVNVIQLACAFTDLSKVFINPKVKVIFDPAFDKVKKLLADPKEVTGLLVHYPSYKNIRSTEGRELLAPSLPWLKVLEA